MKDKQRNNVLSILGLVALLIACVIAVQAIFMGLGAAIPKDSGELTGSQSTQADNSQGQLVQEPDESGAGGADSAQSAPSFCPFCGESLPSSFQWGQYCPYCGEQIEA